MIRSERRGVLPLLALLVFLNSAVCYCLDFGHSHGHAHGHEQESDEPAPHDCECAVVADLLAPDSAPETGPQGPTLTAATAETVVRADENGTRALTEVRPPGANGPPRFVLHRALLL